MTIRRNSTLGRTVILPVPGGNFETVSPRTTTGVAPDPPDGTSVCPSYALLFTGKESDLSVDDAIPGAVFVITAPL